MNEYYERDALNYSTLAALDSNNPGAVFREGRKVSTSAMDRGSLVDCLLTSPDEFNEKFVIVEVTPVSKSVAEVIDTIITRELEYNDSNIILAAKSINFGANWSDEVLLKRLRTEDSRKYYNEKTLQTDKIKISQETYDQAIKVVEVLKTHEFSSWIFEENPDVEIKFQVPLYWKEKGQDCKALLDIIRIDHKNKTIVPIDLKTKSEGSFIVSFLRYKYYIQAVWYSRGVVMEFMKDYEGYTLLDFRFLVISFEYPDPPLIYMCNNDVYTIGTKGGVINGKRIKGVIELFNDYLWYKKEEKYNYPRHIYENKGVVDIDLSLKTDE